MSLLVLSANDVDSLVSEFQPEELQLMMARVFCRFSFTTSNADSSTRGQTSCSDESRPAQWVSMPPRLHVPMLNYDALFMPARVPRNSTTSTGLGDTSVKVVCVPNQSDSLARGLPATTMVLDEITGSVKAIVNARKLTAVRNAAGSLLSTTLFLSSSSPSTRTRPKSLVAFGAGQQIDAHLDLFLRHFPSIKSCTIVNRSANDRAVALREGVRSQFPGVATRLLARGEGGSESSDSDLVLALRRADIVICATPSTVPLFPSSYVRTGAHVVLVGSYKPEMKEVDGELIRRSLVIGGGWLARESRLVVDSRVDCLREAGELIDAGVRPEEVTEIGELLPRKEHGELLDVVAVVAFLNEDQKKQDSDDDEEEELNFDGPVGIFKSVGLGIQDVAIAEAVVEKALNREVGMVIRDYDSCRK